MDALVSSALLEVAAEGVEGCSLPTLWNGLHSPALAAGLQLDRTVKQAVWEALLATPCLAFQVPGSDSIPATDPSIQIVENAQRMRLLIIGSEQLRDSYLGVHDLKHCDSRLSAEQRKTLERLGKARAEGVTQYQLAKEFGMRGNKFFYIVRNLESRGLVVRQSSIFRGERPVATNLIHLKRFANDVMLGSQQRFEIQKSGIVGLEHDKGDAVNIEEPNSGFGSNDVRVNDDLPALKEICTRLEEADGKVLVISDLKVHLGYRLVRGHREWRRLLGRLTAAGLVETFDAKVEEKVLSCIRLLEPFDPKAFSCKSYGPCTDETGTDQYSKGVKRGQITDQVAELSINRQIYDNIKQGGSKGVTVSEIFTCLGLNNRRNYFRLTDMISKHGLRLEAENYKRCTQYRVWTPENAPSLDRLEVSRRFQLEAMPNDTKALHLRGRADGNGSEVRESLYTPNSLKPGSSVEPQNRVMNKGVVCTPKTSQWPLSIVVRGGNTLPAACTKSDELAEFRSPMAGLDLVPYRDDQKQETIQDQPELTFNTVTVASHSPSASECLPAAFSRSSQRVVALSSAHSQREHWIMERLERERFILRAELHKWLEDLECRKDTLLDRKTVIRNLQKLQREGRCKCILLSIPGVTNYGRNRTADVVLLPSVEMDPDLLNEIHDRQRAFDAHIRVQGSLRSRQSMRVGDIPILTGVKRMPQTGSQVVDKGGTLRDNGFISAKIIRCRMLHQFLWMYVFGSKECNSDLCSADGHMEKISKVPDSGGRGIFSLLVAIQAMPLELFLQVIGSTKHVKGLAERCRRGMRLSDLPARESEALLDTNASGRLSWLVDILRRLKLLRIVMIPTAGSDDIGKTSHASVAYAVETRPYIEEPPLEQRTSLSGHVFNLGPSVTHDFHLISRESVDDYWKTLERFFCGADPSSARNVFPGSNVPELFGPRSWTSLRVMSMDQRQQLQKRLGMNDNRRLPYKECVRIAKELNLSLDQVLRVSYEKNQKVRLQEARFSIENASDSSQVNMALGVKYKTVVGKKRSLSPEPAVETVNLEITRKQQHLEQNSMSGELKESPREEELIPMEKADKDFDSQMEPDGDRNDLEAASVSDINVVRKLRPLRKRKFSWKEASDRLLISCYTRQRALLGARYNRVDWNTMQGLPAPPETCRRRIALLKMFPAVRKLLMALCNVLATRYTNHLHWKSEISSTVINTSGDGSEKWISDVSGGNTISTKAFVKTTQNYDWDDFEDLSLSAAVDDIIRCKNASRASSLKKMTGPLAGSRKIKPFGHTLPELLDSNRSKDSHINEMDDTRMVNTIHSDINFTDVSDQGLLEDASQTVNALIPGSLQSPSNAKNMGIARARPNRAHVRKQSKMLINLKTARNTELVQKSMGAASAVELIKLVFLNSSLNSHVSQVLVDALRRCEESDIFMAFSYLKDQGMVVAGQDSRAFVLSPKFFHNFSASPFCPVTGDESLSFQSWLRETREELENDWVTLKPEIQWGELFHLFAIVSSMQLSMKPFMPDKGIGDKNQDEMVRKRKRESPIGSKEHRYVKEKVGLAIEECGFGQRRERGFPSIEVRAHYMTMPMERMLCLESSEITCSGCLSSENFSQVPKHLEAAGATSSFDMVPVSSDQSSRSQHNSLLNEDTHSMNNYLMTESAGEREEEHALGAQSQILDHSLLSAVSDAVTGAGEEGLRIADIAGLVQPDGEPKVDLGEVYADALQSFGIARKVSAFDHVRIVSVPHSERYFLYLTESIASSDGEHGSMDLQGVDVVSLINREPFMIDLFSCAAEDPNLQTLEQENPSGVENIVMVKSGVQFLSDFKEFPASNKLCVSKEEILKGSSGGNTPELVPILPWLEADGKENIILRKALNRRIMGIVMPKPGILEESIIEQIDVLNPMSCKKLLELLVLDGHLSVRTIMQHDSTSPPFLLQAMVKHNADQRKLFCRRHYYANPLSSTLL